MDNRLSCCRWLTTNQDEYQNPACVRVTRNIDSAEVDRYERCMEINAACEEQLRATAKETLCRAEQEMNRETVYNDTESHTDQGLKASKKPWCRCLTTGDPNYYEEHLEQNANAAMCCCKKLYNEMEELPKTANQRTRVTNYFDDYRDPEYNFIATKALHKGRLDKDFWEYKRMADARDEKNGGSFLTPPAEDANNDDPNCLGIMDLPLAKRAVEWKPDETWWRMETPDCIKELVKKAVLATTYSEMNKDGAALPVTIFPTPDTCKETPAGDPMKQYPELHEPAMVNLSAVFPSWDRPQVRSFAGRDDTVYNREYLEYDPYFKDHILQRGKWNRPIEFYEKVTQENVRLAKAEKLRYPFDLNTPGYMAYAMLEVPPICKIRKDIDYNTPDVDVSSYRLDYQAYDKQVYDFNPHNNSFRPLNLAKMGMTGHPIAAACRGPLPRVGRLSCYLETGGQNAEPKPDIK